MVYGDYHGLRLVGGFCFFFFLESSTMLAGKPQKCVEFVLQRSNMCVSHSSRSPGGRTSPDEEERRHGRLRRRTGTPAPPRRAAPSGSPGTATDGAAAFFAPREGQLSRSAGRLRFFKSRRSSHNFRVQEVTVAPPPHIPLSLPPPQRDTHTSCPAGAILPDAHT